MPIISQVPGFVAYYAVKVGDDGIVSLSLEEAQAGAEESSRRAAHWVQQNLASFVQGAPEVIAGEVVVEEAKK